MDSSWRLPIRRSAVWPKSASRSFHASAAGNTWAGTWDSDFGKLALDAGGSGSCAGFNPGTVTGAVMGSEDHGRRREDHSGSFAHDSFLAQPRRMRDMTLSTLDPWRDRRVRVQHALVSERTGDGLAAARTRGRTGGLKPKLTPRQAKIAHVSATRLLVTWRRLPDGTLHRTTASLTATDGRDLHSLVIPS